MKTMFNKGNGLVAEEYSTTISVVKNLIRPSTGYAESLLSGSGKEIVTFLEAIQDKDFCVGLSKHKTGVLVAKDEDFHEGLTYDWEGNYILNKRRTSLSLVESRDNFVPWDYNVYIWDDVFGNPGNKLLLFSVDLTGGPKTERPIGFQLATPNPLDSLMVAVRDENTSLPKVKIFLDTRRKRDDLFIAPSVGIKTLRVKQDIKLQFIDSTGCTVAIEVENGSTLAVQQCKKGRDPGEAPRGKRTITIRSPNRDAVDGRDETQIVIPENSRITFNRE